jgi:hypothetical protein
MFTSWLRSLTSRVAGPDSHRKQRRSHRTRPALEVLEDRLAPAILIVNTNVDVVNPTDGTLSLRDAILAVGAGNANGLTAGETNQVSGTFGSNDTIQFDARLAGQTITLASALPALSSNVAIIGLGATNLSVSGAGLYQILDVSSGVTASISGLKIEDGNSPNGGGIDNAGSLTVSNCAFASDVGGGIYNTGPLTVSNSTFSGNTGASFNGEETYGTPFTTPMGSGIYNSNGSLAMVNGGTFSDNTGSGIFNYYDSAAGSTLSTVIVSDCTFSQNQAAFGGGIANLGGVAQVSDSTFSDNYVFGLSLSTGGGIDNNVGGTLTVSSSTFSGNQAGYNQAGQTFSGDGGYGGAIGEGDASALSTITVSDSTFFGNRALLYGGGIFNFQDTLTVTSCTLSGNSAATGGGGGIYVGHVGFTGLFVGNTIIAGNTGPSGPDVLGRVTSNGYNLIGSTSGSSGFGALDKVGLDPKLAALGDYGGPTQTMALLPGSPAIDAGSNALAVDANGQPLQFDQRGAPFLRVVNGTVDIGAYEGAPDAPPVNTVPGALTTDQGVPVAVTGISVSDPDAGSAPIQMTLSVLHGTLTVATNTFGGLAAGNISGNGSGTVVLTGSQAQINATLATTGGLSYTPAIGYFGADTLTVSTNDLGHFGFGGPQTAVNAVPITVVSALQEVSGLISQAQADMAAGILTNGQGTSMINSALKKITDTTGIALIDKFIADVQKLVLQGKLSQANADPLLQAALRIRQGLTS